MIKKCKVLLSNESVCVVDFDGTHIQMPALQTTKSPVAYIKLSQGYYSESTESEYVQIGDGKDIPILPPIDPEIRVVQKAIKDNKKF